MATTPSRRLVATIARKLGLNKGAPRVWLEGVLPARAGFTPGRRYTAEVSQTDARVILRLDNQGIRLVSSKVKDSSALPVIDLNSRELLSRFEGMNTIRVVMMDGEIHILPDAVEIKKRERADRLAAAVASKDITIASVSHGVGVLTHAMHQGMRDAGLNPRLLWACEIREEVLEQAARVNDAWNDETIALGMPIQQLAFADTFTLGQLPRPIVLEGGLPCTAASVAGRSKKGLAKAEDDETAGHLIAAFVALIAKVNPVVVLLENVRPYFTTASASILRTSLKELGYVVQEREIDGGDYAIEARPRCVLVAVTQGMEFDLSMLDPPQRNHETIGSILDAVPSDDPSWSPMTYLRDKEVRDKAAGKGFAMQAVGPDDTRVGTIGTGYQKNRSTEPKVKHPTDPNLLRLFTPAEHARLKGVPDHLIGGVTSKTFAHELLGQSVIWPAFKHLGHHLATAIARGISPKPATQQDTITLPLLAA